MKNVLYFSLLNFRTFYKTSIKIIVSFIVIITGMTLSYGYKNAISKEQERNIQSKMSKAFILTDEKLDSCNEKMFDSWMANCEISLPGLEIISVGDYYIEFEAEEKRKGVDTQDYYFKRKKSKYADEKNYSSQIDCEVVNCEGALFSNFDLEQFQNEYPNEEIFRYNTEPFAEETAMISDYLLKCFGYTEGDFSKLCGKKFSLLDSEGNYIFKEAKLSAIINSNIYFTDAHNYRSQLILGENVTTDTEKFPFATDDGSLKYKWRYYTGSFRQLNDSVRELEKQNIVVRDYDEQLFLLEAQSNVTDNVIIVIVWMVVGMTLIAISIAVYFKCKYYQKNYAMMYSLGCTKIKVFWIFEFEILLEFLIAAAFSIGFVNIGYKIFEDGIFAMTSVRFTDKSFFDEVFWIVSGVVLLLLLIYGMFNIVGFSGKKALEDLNAE